jgi:signal peptidase I
MKSQRKLLTILIICFISIIFVYLYLFRFLIKQQISQFDFNYVLVSSSSSPNFPNTNNFLLNSNQILQLDFNKKCQIQIKKVKIQGNSLTGLFFSGQIIPAYFNYYNCYNPERGDIIIFKYGNEFLIKIIKGLPGDKISFRQVEGGAWNVLINNQVLKTTTNIPYAIIGQTFNQFLQYVNEAGGTIPENKYLILGNIPSGGLDSFKFGFVDKEDLIAKAIY